MTIELPDDEVAPLGLTTEQLCLELAMGLYAARKVSLGRAARIARVPYSQFMQEAAVRRISIDYTEADARQDIQAVRQRLGK